MNIHIANTLTKQISWSKLSSILTSPIARSTLAIPLVGYLVLFNDTAASTLTFEDISEGKSSLRIASQVRLQMIYFGLLLVAVATFWFRLRCPTQIQAAADRFGYRKFAFENFAIADFANTFFRLEREHQYGQFDDTQFDRDNFNSFFATATNNEIGTPATDDEYWFAISKVNNKDDALKVSNEFLCNLLDADYKIANASSRKEVLTISIIGMTGAALLAVPSIDMFLTICTNVAYQIW